MSILNGYKKFKKYIKTSSGFQLQSLWTSANTVEADDKRTIQTKVGAINGISSSETANSSEIAASTALTNKMNGTINNLSRDFAGGQMEIRLTEAGKGEYRKKGADTWIPFRSEIRIINIFLPPHRDNWGHMDIDVSDYSTLSIGSVTTSGGHTAEIMGDDVLIGSYKHGDKNIILNISDVKKLRFRNSLKTTDFSRYVDFGNVTIS